MVLYWERILLPLGGPGPAPIKQTGKIAAPVLGLFGEDDGKRFCRNFYLRRFEV
jgi:hypothetical protein